MNQIEKVARAKEDAQKLRWDTGTPVRVFWRDGRVIWSKIDDEGRDLTADNSDGMLHHVRPVFVEHGAINPLEAKAAIAAMPAQAEPVATRWQLGDKVRKKRGSSWRGTVCGFYTTPHTPQGYCVDSAFEPGSVQVWPEAALEDWDGVMAEDELRAEITRLRAALRQIQDEGDVRANAIATATLGGSDAE